MRADRPERAEACQEQRCGDEDTGDEYGDTEEVDSMNGDDIIEYEDGDKEQYEVHEAEDGNVNCFIQTFFDSILLQPYPWKR